MRKRAYAPGILSPTLAIRLDFCRQRMRAGERLVDIAADAGFADQSHFHKTFVSYTAATPRQYAQSRSISDNK